MSLAFVKKWYDNIPPIQRLIPLVPLNGKIYSPARVLEEVKKGTKLGEELQTKLETGQFTTQSDLELIAEKRLEWMITHLPDVIGFNTLTVDGKPITKEELLQMIREKKGLGARMIQQEVQEIKRMLEG